MTIEQIKEALLKGAETVLIEGGDYADMHVISSDDEDAFDVAEDYREGDDENAMAAGPEANCLFLLFVREAISE